MIKLRAFRAIDDLNACKKFMLGHRAVLENIGVKKITSSKDEWMENPAVFVIIVENIESNKVLGGARVHVAEGKQPLPIEEATGYLDDSIYGIIKKYADNGTGEICGLWNSREVAGMGIGSVFLTRACVAISSQIQLQSLFALCAPYTISMAENVGYTILYNVGKNGTFYYPKLDLVATAMILEDVALLSKASMEERNSIFDLRKNPNQIKNETLKNKDLVLNFNLEIQNIEDWYNSGIIKNIIK